MLVFQDLHQHAEKLSRSLSSIFTYIRLAKSVTDMPSQPGFGFSHSRSPCFVTVMLAF